MVNILDTKEIIHYSTPLFLSDQAEFGTGVNLRLLLSNLAQKKTGVQSIKFI